MLSFIPCCFLPIDQKNCSECECTSFNVFFAMHLGLNGTYEDPDTVNGIGKNIDRQSIDYHSQFMCQSLFLIK